MQDMRSVRTKKAIQDTFLSLVHQRKFIDLITVKDICDLSMVSRTTFYQYFEDKYDLVCSILQDALQNWQEPDFGRFLETVREERVFFGLIDQDPQLQMRCQGVFCRALAERYPEWLCIQMGAGLLALVKWWNKQNYLPESGELAKDLTILFDTVSMIEYHS